MQIFYQNTHAPPRANLISVLMRDSSNRARPIPFPTGTKPMCYDISADRQASPKGPLGRCAALNGSPVSNQTESPNRRAVVAPLEKRQDKGRPPCGGPPWAQGIRIIPTLTAARTRISAYPMNTPRANPMTAFIRFSFL